MLQIHARRHCLPLESPRADMSENPVHLEDEVFPVEEHEERHREEEIP
jgi:hypothetical protein